MLNERHNSPPQFRLLISIVNYRASDLVCKLLPGLMQQLDLSVDYVCIVDNDSGDESVIVLEQFIQSRGLTSNVTLVASQKNGGFSFGNNLAITSAINHVGATPQFVLLLNPDTLLAKPAIAPLLAFMEKTPEAGIAGSRLESQHGDGQCSAFRFPSIRSEVIGSLRLGVINRLFPDWSVSSIGIPATETQVDWVAGASMMIRYKVIEDIGLMDEQYFLYFEETDFCLQAVRKGWQCWYVPSSTVVHYVGQSTGVVSGDVQRRRRPQYWFESRQYYYRKSYGVFYTMLVDLVWGAGFALWRVRRALQRKPDTDPEHMLFDFWRNSIFFSWLGKKSSAFKNIKNDYRANCKPINTAGFRTLLVYRFGRWRMTVKPKLLRAPLSFLYRQMEKHVRFKYGIELPYTATLGTGVRFEHQHGIVVHGNAVIGDGSIIRQGVTIGNRSLDKPLYAPVIGKHVNIGAGAKILGNIRIGDNVSIGANAVVLTDIPDNSVAVGIPAKVIKQNVKSLM